MSDPEESLIPPEGTTLPGAERPDDPGAPAWRAGDRVGRFRLLARLGAGGFGEVWLARDPGLDREVAIKCLHGRLAAHRDVRERFEREARVLAALEHPGVVKVLEVGQESTKGCPWFAMEYVAGAEPMDRRLEADWAPAPWEVAWILAAFASALAHVHERGYVHRDIKPGNVLLTDDPSRPIVLIDLGIAKETTESLGFTGTPAYQAPEVVARGEYSERSDIYALGVVLYECLLNGDAPWRKEARRAARNNRPESGAGADKRYDHLARLRAEAPRMLRRYAAAVPRDLRAILGAALAEYPEERYATARGLAQDLRDFLDGGVPAVLQVSRTTRLVRATRRTARRRPGVFAAALVVLFLAATAGAWQAREWWQAREDLRARERELQDLWSGFELLGARADAAVARGELEAAAGLAREMEERGQAFSLSHAREDLADRAGGLARATRRGLALARARDLLARARKLEPEPGTPEPWTFEPRSLGASKLYEEAASRFEEAADLGATEANLPAAECRVASIRARNRPRELAAAAIQEVVDLERARRRETLEEARKVLNRALQLDPRYAEAYFRRGRLQHRLGLTEAAWDDLGLALRHDPDHAAAYWTRGLLLAYRLASDVQDRRPLEGFASHVYASLPPAERGLSLREVAHRAFAAAARADPEVFGVLAAPFRRVLAAQPITAEDVRALRRLMERRRDMPEVPLVLGALVSGISNNIPGLQWEHHRAVRQDLDEALDLLNQHLELDPSSPIGLRCRGFLQLVMGRYGDAIRDLEDLRELSDPLELLPRAQLAECYRMVGRPERAAEITAGYLKEFPGSPRAVMVHARSLHMLGRTPESLELLDQLMKRKEDTTVRPEAALIGFFTCLDTGDVERGSAYLKSVMAGRIPEVQTQGLNFRTAVQTAEAMLVIIPRETLIRSAAGAIVPFVAPPESKKAWRDIQSPLKRFPTDFMDRIVGVSVFTEDRRIFIARLQEAMSNPEFMENLVRSSEGISLSEVMGRRRTRVDVGTAGACLVIGAAKLEEVGVMSFQGLRLPDDLCTRAAMRLREGRPDLAERDLREAVRRDRLHVPSAYGLATVIALRAREQPERGDEAVEALRDAWRAGWERMDWTRRDPDFSALRGLASFEALIQEASIR